MASPPFRPFAGAAPEPRRGGALGPVLGLLGLALLPSVLALLALVGLGALRDASPLVVAGGAVALTFLPALGLSGLARNRPAAVGAALLVWSLALLLGVRAYFPGERAKAIAHGVAWIGAADEPGPVATKLGAFVDAALGGDVEPAPAPEPAVTTPAPPPLAAAAPVEPAPAAPPPAAAGEDATVEYQGEGQSLRVPVVFEGPGGEVSIPWMIFDTGATFTTLDTVTLDALGIPVPDDAPEVTLHAATGAHQARLVLAPRVTLGGLPVGGVTIAVCDTCASHEAKGLLGLNVSSQFLVTLDPDQRRMVLRPRGGAPDRKLDLEPWVKPAATIQSWDDGRVEAEIVATNRAPRSVDEVVFEIQCPEAHHEVRLHAIAERASGTKRVAFPKGSRCESSTIRLSGGSW